MPVAEFKKEMDRYVGEARAMRPFPGEQRAELAGGPEWQRQREYARDGIPVGDDHCRALAEIAVELGVDTPFAAYDHTRFGEEQ